MMPPAILSPRPSLRCTALSGAVLAAIIIGGPPAAHAQEGQPPIRRAQPAPPIARAVPAGNPAPQTTGNPEIDLYTYSTWVYSEGHYDIAAQQFAQYTNAHPNGKNLDGAFYYLGESLLKLDRPGDAASAFYQVVSRFQEGQFGSPSAYQLGALSVGQGEFDKAVPYFEIAEDQAKDPKIKEAAEYRRAKCLIEMGQDGEAAQVFALLSETRGNPAIREDSLKELARIQSRMGNTEDAAASFERLANTAATDATGGGALIQAGILQSDNGNPERARELIQEGLAKGVTGIWKASATYTLLQLDVQAGDFTSASLRFAELRVNDLPEGMRPRAYLLAGHAQRKSGELAAAAERYRAVTLTYPTSAEAPEAGYFKLLTLYQMSAGNGNAADIPGFVDDYVVARATDGRGEDFIDRALLLKAESYFAGGDYARAAASYGQIKLGNIPEAIGPAMLYNRGWSESEAGDKTAAAGTLGRFLELYPDHPSTPDVLAARALAYRELNDRSLAQADLTRITEEFPDSPNVELALQQAGLIHGESSEWEQAIASFTQLLEKFPESVAAPEAHFYTGKAHYELKAYDESTPFLIAARDSDSEAYFHMASNLLIYANYLGENPDQLSSAIDTYLESNPDASVGTKVLSWLGAQRYEGGNFKDAAKYLTLAAADAPPGDEATSIWLYLAEARIAIEEWDGGVEAARQFIGSTSSPTSQGRGHYLAAQALLGKGDFDAADAEVQAGLGLVKQGSTNGDLTVLQGDIALGRGDALAAAGNNAGASAAFEAAVAKYVIVSQIFIDHNITPSALSKAATAYERLGQIEKANATRAELKAKYPNYGQ